jgi:hypothetical protein
VGTARACCRYEHTKRKKKHSHHAQPGRCMWAWADMGRHKWVEGDGHRCEQVWVGYNQASWLNVEMLKLNLVNFQTDTQNWPPEWLKEWLKWLSLAWLGLAWLSCCIVSCIVLIPYPMPPLL